MSILTSLRSLKFFTAFLIAIVVLTAIGLFAFRYGYVPPVQHTNPKGWSITEMEFRRAEALSKSCLTFVVKDTTPWSRTYEHVCQTGLALLLSILCDQNRRQLPDFASKLGAQRSALRCNEAPRSHIPQRMIP